MRHFGKLTLILLALLIAGIVPTYYLFGQTAHNISLTWGASSTAGVKYDVYRATSSTGPFASVATDIATLAYVDASGTGGTTYYYRITAVCDTTTSCPAGISGESAPTPTSAGALFLGSPAAPAAAPTVQSN